MKADLQRLFALHVTWLYAQLYIGRDPATPPPPAFGLVYEGAYIGQQR